jgi:chromosome segregation ATPase
MTSASSTNDREALNIARLGNMLLSQRLKEETALRQRAEAEVLSLTSDNDRKNGQIGQLRGLLAVKERDLLLITQQSNVKDGQIEGLAKALTTKEIDYNNLDDYTKELRQRHSSLQATYERKELKIDNLQHQIGSLTTDLSTVRERVKLLEADLEKYDLLDLEEIEHSMEESKQRAEQLEADIQQSQLLIANIQNQIAELKAEKAKRDYLTRVGIAVRTRELLRSNDQMGYKRFHPEHWKLLEECNNTAHSGNGLADAALLEIGMWFALTLVPLS